MEATARVFLICDFYSMLSPSSALGYCPRKFSWAWHTLELAMKSQNYILFLFLLVNFYRAACNAHAV